MFGNNLFLQAAVYSGAAALFILVSGWWLYLSPMKKSGGEAAPPSPRLAGWLAGLLSVASLMWVVGALWDASMHIKTGEIPAGADFLWPPHLVLYGGFLLAFLVAVLVVGVIAAKGWQTGVHDPRRWVRQNPYLGAVALASLYEMMAIPGDALWHEIFGRDLTAWSPPHVMIGLMIALVITSAIGVLIQSFPGKRRAGWRDAAIVLLLGLMLNTVYIIGVLEWELPVHSTIVDSRPIWYYPLVGGSLAFFALALAKRLVRWRWSATATASVFYLVRLPVTLGLHLTGNITPALPLVFILGAIFMDLVPLQQISSPALRWLVTAAAFTAGFALLALPALTLRASIPVLNTGDLTYAIAGTLLATLLLLPVAWSSARRLLGKRAQV
ncbi:MAG: hypothetical protein ACM3PY_07095 [Omnitrophica WOR_2 bacterium]